MITRRGFLRHSVAFSAGAALAPMLTGCGVDDALTLRIQLLNRSLPLRLIGQFRNGLPTGNRLAVVPEAQLEQIFDLLKTWQTIAQGEKVNQPWWNRIPLVGKPLPTQANLVSLGDAWLQSAIEQEYIQPLGEVEQWQGWENLPSPWQNVVRRDREGNYDGQGEIWGAPYRWGNTLIAYHQDALRSLQWTPQDWGDLWHPDLRDRLTVINQPREIIGLTLKKLGYSYNTPDLNAVPELLPELKKLAQQIKFYSSTHYLQPLVIKDAWVAVGWSSDILPLMQQYPQIKAVVPASGTARWVDLWVKPQGSNKPALDPLLQQWVEFYWQTQAAQNITLNTSGTSPILLTGDRTTLPPDLQNNPLRLPPLEVIENSEFLLPLPDSTTQQYEEFWRAMRTSDLNRTAPSS
ncbi:extracellular solute-binding protein [Spirulina subsalsa FACHB-351]|uniref:Extracellular solute-binding protein n=1 Tax=Spirulina subsalsa FACHB-351 TaxID=234711 RepID=A0ABT3L6T8_9CYAN|nr:extracellular solute-binding protein [Spirulina subsalsa]MCW6036789.1 extracellular solute-binding protein [Spirulina subsalsa FACHB-351]